MESRLHVRVNKSILDKLAKYNYSYVYGKRYLYRGKLSSDSSLVLLYRIPIDAVDDMISDPDNYQWQYCGCVYPDSV